LVYFYVFYNVFFVLSRVICFLRTYCPPIFSTNAGTSHIGTVTSLGLQAIYRLPKSLQLMMLLRIGFT